MKWSEGSYYYKTFLIYREGVTRFFFSFSLKDRLKKFTVEKEALESQLKNEKDEKELYKVLRSKCWRIKMFSCFVFSTLLQTGAPVLKRHHLSGQAIPFLFSSGFFSLSLTFLWLVPEELLHCHHGNRAWNPIPHLSCTSRSGSFRRKVLWVYLIPCFVIEVMQHLF